MNAVSVEGMNSAEERAIIDRRGRRQPKMLLNERGAHHGACLRIEIPCAEFSFIDDRMQPILAVYQRLLALFERQHRRLRANPQFPLTVDTDDDGGRYNQIQALPNCLARRE